MEFLNSSQRMKDGRNFFKKPSRFPLWKTVEKPAETQTRIRLASHSVSLTPDLEGMISNTKCGGNSVH